MSILGIYFGSNVITLVETKDKKIVQHTTLARSQFFGDELEEKVPDEVKVVTLLKDEIRKNQIEAKETVLCLSGKDVIIRTFEMPLLAPDELASAIIFEAKKYIPFKIDELISDFQVQIDRTSRRNLVLYAGIKKAVLDSYLNMLNQLNIKVVAVEYSAFSILRFLQLNTPISNRGIVGVISADLQEEDEVHFTIMENGFPLFSRDITLRSISEKAEAAEKLESGMLQEKLKTEVRISLDYYNRKLPTKGIEKVFIVASESYRSILETVAKEIGLPLVAMGTNPYLSSTASLGLVKGYGSSLYRAIRTKLKIDLLASKTKGRAAQEAPAAIDIGVILRGFKVSPLAFIAGIAMVGAAVGYGQFQIGPLNRDRNLLVAARPPVKAVKPDATVQELERLNSDYKKKIGVMDSLLKNQPYSTELLDVIPRAIPEGVWLTHYAWKRQEGKVELGLEGFSYASDNESELKYINTFVTNLKESTVFSKTFQEINILSIQRQEIDKNVVTNFSIVCRSKK